MLMSILILFFFFNGDEIFSFNDVDILWQIEKMKNSTSKKLRQNSSHWLWSSISNLNAVCWCIGSIRLLYICHTRKMHLFLRCRERIVQIGKKFSVCQTIDWEQEENRLVVLRWLLLITYTVNHRSGTEKKRVSCHETRRGETSRSDSQERNVKYIWERTEKNILFFLSTETVHLHTTTRINLIVLQRPSSKSNTLLVECFVNSIKLRWSFHLASKWKSIWSIQLFRIFRRFIAKFLIFCGLISIFSLIVSVLLWLIFIPTYFHNYSKNPSICTGQTAMWHLKFSTNVNLEKILNGTTINIDALGLSVRNSREVKIIYVFLFFGE